MVVGVSSSATLECAANKQTTKEDEMRIVRYENGEMIFIDHNGQKFHFYKPLLNSEGQLVALINVQGLVVLVDEGGNLMMY